MVQLVLEIFEKDNIDTNRKFKIPEILVVPRKSKELQLSKFQI